MNTNDHLLIANPQSTTDQEPAAPESDPHHPSIHQSINPAPSAPSPLNARTGKIARLPHAIRDQLNHRLHDGQKATTILPWLNSLPEVRSILDAEFGGHPVSPSNLSEWRRGGYREQDFIAWAKDPEICKKHFPELCEKRKGGLTAEAIAEMERALKLL